MYSEEGLSGLQLEIWQSVSSGRAVKADPGYPEVPFDLIRQLVLGHGPDRPRRLKLSGVQITGDLDLEAATLVCPLWLTDCRMGEWNFEQAEAKGIYLESCRFLGFRGSQLHTKHTLAITDCIVTGTVKLGGAKIDGQLVLADTRITNLGKDALSADGLTVGQDLICTGRFTLAGGCHLIGAHIQGQFVARGATFYNPGDMALDASHLTVSEATHWDEGFTATGEVRLIGAQIGGQFCCVRGTFSNSKGCAILADGLEARRDVIFGPEGDSLNPEDITTVDGIVLTDAVIHGRLMCAGTRFSRAGDKAIRARGLTVGRSLVLRDTTVVEGSIDLRRARVGELADQGFAWPEKVLLVEFVYGGLQPINGVRERIKWLKRNGSFSSQIYRQLALAYRTAGHLEQADRVLVAEQWARRRTPSRRFTRWFAQLKGAGLWATVGYGFSPLRILISLILLEIAGGTLFSTQRKDISLTKAAQGAGADFQPWLYSLDLLLPVVNLRQRDLVIVHGASAWCSSFFVIAGWALGTALVIGVGSAIKRTE
ncbi:hypothetical protein OG239_00485 [Streptomyces sp. NBC_00868]|uniref:hypothetical protein n=1 Tax=unclassified Streptomyces TaxID=2593676 RepID=UPI0032496AFE|nr:hypothetical protein OG239_00485 [Streptomyces sp. NBC_00868]